jgi:hypothetical protein
MAEEAQAYLRALEPCGREAESAARGNARRAEYIGELRASPDMIETWLFCEVLLKRLHHPSPALHELEAWLCAMPCIHAVGVLADAGTPATRTAPDGSGGVTPDALGRLHAEMLIQLLHDGTPSNGDNGSALADHDTEAWLRQDGWMHALGAALAAGLWDKAYPDTVCPLLTVEPPAEKSATTDSHHKGSKFGEWVTEIGPPLCGTFGCILPNNHAGLHQLPESERGSRVGRLRRESSQESNRFSDGSTPAAGEVGHLQSSVDPAVLSAAAAITCVTTAHTLEQRTKGLRPYAATRPLHRMMALRALCRGLLTPSERKKVRVAGSRLHIGSCMDADYWAVPPAFRVYRLYRACRSPSSAELPVGAPWEPVSLERDDFVAFGTTLARCCVANSDGSRAGAACHAMLNRLRDRVPLADHSYLEPPLPPEPLWEPEPEPTRPPRSRPTPILRPTSADNRAERKDAERRRDRNVGKRERFSAPHVEPSPAYAAEVVDEEPLAAAPGMDDAVLDGDAAADERMPSPPRVRVQLRAQRVPVGHRQLAVRACLKLSVPRQRKLSSTLRFRQQEAGPQHWHDPRHAANRST